MPRLPFTECCSSLLRASFATASLCLVQTSAIAGDLHIVDNTGHGDFVTIQEAINAAQSGDQIIVEGGSYTGFNISVNSVHISAREGEHVQINGPIHIRNIPSGGIVTLHRLDRVGGSVSAQPVAHGLLIRNCEGSVRARDCDFAGFKFGTVTGHGVRVENSADVGLVGCRAFGAWGGQLGHGLSAMNSNISVFSGTMIGGGGGSGQISGDGVHLSGSAGNFFGTNSTFQGGWGAEGQCIGSYVVYAGDGGNGFVNTTWDARLMDSDLQSGPGGIGEVTWDCNVPNGAPGVESIGPISWLSGSSPVLEVAQLVRPELGLLDFTVRGTPGDRVFLRTSLQAGYENSSRHVGPLLLAEPLLGILYPIGSGSPQLGGGVPLAIESEFLGVIGSNGSLLKQIPLIPSVAPGKTRHAQFQTMVVGPGGEVQVSDPSSLTFLPCDTGEDCNGNGTPDGCDITGGTSLDCNYNGIPDECEDDCNQNGIPDDCDISTGTSLDSNSNDTPDECEGQLRLHVNIQAPPGGNGLTWATAFNDLQDAFDFHQTNPHRMEEIWVARGIYKPSSAGNPALSFRPGSYTTVRGGFAGTETFLSERDLAANPTILSGDLAGDDVFPMGIDENSYHVLLIEEADDVLVDGFTIRGGHSRPPESGGAGIKVIGCQNFLLSQLKVEQNTSQTGAGVQVAGYYPNDPSSGSILNCSLSNNRAIAMGFLGHAIGGGIGIGYVEQISLVNCEITGNYSDTEGAAAWCGTGDSIVHFLGCTIANNRTDLGYSGVYTAGSPVTVHGTIAWDNTTNSTVPEEQGSFTGVASSFDVRLSCVEGPTVFPGNGNINLDPMFVNAGLGDYRLAAGSPCIDAGRNGAIPNEDPTDLDQDGILQEELPLDLGGVTRRIDDPSTPDTGSGAAPVVDMGAHEFDPGAPQD